MAEPVKFLSSRFLSASTPVGAEVRNPQDESLGDLKDVMVDSTSGRIAYGILTFGGVLGIGTKEYADQIGRHYARSPARAGNPASRVVHWERGSA